MGNRMEMVPNVFQSNNEVDIWGTYYKAYVDSRVLHVLLLLMDLIFQISSSIANIMANMFENSYLFTN
jgi:hypothetical protein